MMNTELKDMLLSHGVQGRYIGYKYFIRAMERVVEQPDRLQKLRDEIYIPIAKEFKKTAGSVEKALRKVRDVFMQNGGAELLKKIGGGDFWYQTPPCVGELLGIFEQYFNKKQ